MPTFFVTSHLCLGDIPLKVSGLRLRAEGPDDAVKIIEAGGTAVLPRGDYDAAAEVLRRFGATEDHIEWMLFGGFSGAVDAPILLDNVHPVPPDLRLIRSTSDE